MEKDIGRIKKNDNTDIVVRIDDFGGRSGLTIREFVSGDKYTGFTKAGVRILAENFQRFKDMINSISPNDLKESPGASASSSAHSKPTAGKTEAAENHSTAAIFLCAASTGGQVSAYRLS